MLKNDVDRSDKGYDIVVNVVAPRNRNVYFTPISDTLQGEVDIKKISTDKVPGVLNAVGGNIPGYQLQIDTKKKRARIVDRLKQEENREIEAACRKVHANSDSVAFQKLGEQWKRGDGVADEDEFDLDRSAPNNLATWLYHCQIRVARGRFEVVKGQFPEMQEIRRMGDIYLGDNYGLSAKEGKPPFNWLNQEDSAEKTLVGAGGK